MTALSEKEALLAGLTRKINSAHLGHPYHLTVEEMGAVKDWALENTHVVPRVISSLWFTYAAALEQVREAKAWCQHTSGKNSECREKGDNALCFCFGRCPHTKAHPAPEEKEGEL